MSNSTGTLFVVTTFGESHGAGLGAVVDGCPAGISITADDIQVQLDRRRPGTSSITTSRVEDDRVEILSGLENGTTLGTPIGLLVRNKDHRSDDYASMANVPRPSHADFTYKQKYGLIAASGGGRASARETVGRVAAAGIAEKFLESISDIKIVSWVSSVGTIEAPDLVGSGITRAQVDTETVRCPDADAAGRMVTEIEAARAAKDSLGGIVTCECRGIPAGWGEPVFGKLEARLASAMLSIPATKGFEIGSGFSATRMRGSEHNDVFVKKGNSLGTATNNSGGVQGGIANGEPVVLNVAFKPTATVGLPQETVAYDGSATTFEASGRHDPCVLPRAVPVVEAMAALVLADVALAASRTVSLVQGP